MSRSRSTPNRTGGMPSIRRLQIEPLTGARFRPYGQVVGVRSGRPSYRSGGGAAGWLLDFEIDGQMRLSVSRTPFQPLTFHMLERHSHVTQTFVLLDGSPAVLAVAAPGDEGRVPEPDTVRAFLLEHGTGVLLSRGTWHTLTRYPLRPPASVFVVISERETASDPTRSQEVDYLERFGLTFQISRRTTRQRPRQRGSHRSGGDR
jgi:ureidoglycolate hydrolase